MAQMAWVEGTVREEAALRDHADTPVVLGVAVSSDEAPALGSSGSLRPTMWTQDYDFGPPPRRLSASLRLQLWFFNDCCQMAGCAWVTWCFILFGLVILVPLLQGGASRVAILATTNTKIANATEIVQSDTGMSVQGASGDVGNVYKYSYSFQTEDGHSIRSKCYGECSNLTNYLVAYSTFEPTASVLEGMRPNFLALQDIFTFLHLPQLLGWLLMMCSCCGCGEGRKQARLLGSGVAARAVLSKYDTKLLKDDDFGEFLEYKLTFQMKSPRGTLHEVEDSRNGGYGGTDPETYTSVTSGYEHVLYDPAEPRQAIFLHRIPQYGRVQADGNLKANPSYRSKFLWVLGFIAAVDVFVTVTCVAYVVFYLRGVNTIPPQ
mmetsp:Transcript_2309/g.3979  ORF Transcript_2309/g.3979 Transcript_2309/m.3979 type:complete len:377 (+) Transcript_2309:62-1192(+)